MFICAVASVRDVCFLFMSLTQSFSHDLRQLMFDYAATKRKNVCPLFYCTAFQTAASQNVFAVVVFVMI